MGWAEWGDWSDIPMLLDTFQSTLGEYTEILSSLAVRVSKAVWNESTRRWHYDCGLQSVGKVCLQPESILYETGWGAYCSQITLEKVNIGDSTFNFGYDNTLPREETYGSYPNYGDHSSYDSVFAVLLFLTEIALNRITEHISYELTALELIARLCGIPTNLENELERQWIEFVYSPNSPESNCWYTWTVGAWPSSRLEFRLNYKYYGLEMMPPTAYCIENDSLWNIITPHPPESMSSIDKEIYGLVEIPASAIEKSASKLGLSSELVTKHLHSGEPLYVITNPYVTVESRKYEHQRKITNEEIDIFNQMGWH